MKPRNIDDLDIATLLTKTGFVTGEPEWDNDHQNYKYEVEGTDAIGEGLTAIVTIDELNLEIIVITVW